MPVHTVFATPKNDESFVFNPVTAPRTVVSSTPDNSIAVVGQQSNAIEVNVEEFL